MGGLAKIGINRSDCASQQQSFLCYLMKPSSSFQSSRGWRQEDPLSPFLFVLVMEIHSCLLKRAMESGFLLGFKVRGSGVRVEASHLLLTDILVFCKATQNQMTRYLSWTLM